MIRLVKRLRADTAGSVAIEYALIGGIVSVAVIVGALAIGTQLNSGFQSLVGWLK